MWETNKGTIECDKSEITCNVGTAQCDDETVKCEEKKKVQLNVVEVHSYLKLVLPDVTMEQSNVRKKCDILYHNLKYKDVPQLKWMNCSNVTFCCCYNIFTTAEVYVS